MIFFWIVYQIKNNSLWMYIIICSIAQFITFFFIRFVTKIANTIRSSRKEGIRREFRFFSRFPITLLPLSIVNFTTYVFFTSRNILETSESHFSPTWEMFQEKSGRICDREAPAIMANDEDVACIDLCLLLPHRWDVLISSKSQLCTQA